MRRATLGIAVLLVSCLPGLSAQTASQATQLSTGAAAATATLPTSDHNALPAPTLDNHDHNWHLRLGTIHGSMGYFRGPAFDPYAPDGYSPFYSPAAESSFREPFWPYYRGYAPNSGYARDKGEIKLTEAPKNAKVYLDGAYAGTANHLKHIWLDPGAYDLAVAVPDGGTFQQRIYVLGGKTMKIAANQAPRERETLPEKEKP